MSNLSSGELEDEGARKERQEINCLYLLSMKFSDNTYRLQLQKSRRLYSIDLLEDSTNTFYTLKSSKMSYSEMKNYVSSTFRSLILKPSTIEELSPEDYSRLVSSIRNYYEGNYPVCGKYFSKLSEVCAKFLIDEFEKLQTKL